MNRIQIREGSLLARYMLFIGALPEEVFYKGEPMDRTYWTSCRILSRFLEYTLGAVFLLIASAAVGLFVGWGMWTALAGMVLMGWYYTILLISDPLVHPLLQMGLILQCMALAAAFFALLSRFVTLILSGIFKLWEKLLRNPGEKKDPSVKPKKKSKSVFKELYESYKEKYCTPVEFILNDDED